MERLGLEYLSTFGLPPIELVELAADLGLGNISTSLRGSPMNLLGYPSYSLADDKALRRETVAVMRDRGVSISLGEGFIVQPDIEARDRAPDIEAMHELGVKRINTVSFDPDLERTLDQFAIIAEMGTEAGMEITTEFVPCMTVADLPTALRAARHVGRPNFRLVIDTMHFARSGAVPADLAAIDPDLIGYVQLCDVPLAPAMPDYMEEAMTQRLPPGEGEVPLQEILSHVPGHIVVSLEVPQLAKARAGLSHLERLRPAVKAAQDLLDRLN